MTDVLIKRYTKTYNFKIINYDFPRWHSAEWDNWDQLDAIMQAAGLNSVNGIWANNTAYIVGNRLIDTTDGSIWQCLVNHTSAATGTFAADRTAHPTYWTIFSTIPNYRGAWTTATSYNPGDIVYVNSYTYYYCIGAHTSSAAFATDAAKWALIFDATAAVNTTTTKATEASNSAAAAATSATNASTSATNAATSATNASNSATAAAGSATTASTQATNASNSATSAAGSATTATTQATNASTSATNAATSATNAANSYDSFDDRYLGVKTGDPTLDNDGNALVTGALYYRSTTPIGMKVYDGAAWGAVALSDAASDDLSYVRRNGVWIRGPAVLHDAAITGGSATYDALPGVSLMTKWKEFLVLWENLYPSTSGSIPFLQVWTGSTPTLRSTSYHETAQYNASGAQQLVERVNQTAWQIAGAGLDLSTIPGSGHMHIHHGDDVGSVWSSTMECVGRCWNNAAGKEIYIRSVGVCAATGQNVTGVRFFFNAGNITSGRIKIIGLV
jgi:hypothetical protein